MFICENCKNSHDGEYGSGRFCSSSCMHAYVSKCKNIDKNKNKNLIFEYICETCGTKFNKITKIRNGRKITCNNCKNNAVHYKKNPKSIFDFSKRTVSKIFSRGKVKCVLCGWNNATCDVHHIISKKDGGSNDNSNLIILCPNCHRELHSHTLKISNEQLFKKSIKNIWEELIKYYYPSN